jgi:HIV Tat-specific factor 1
MPDPVEEIQTVKSRVVVLKHMFTLEDLEKDASLLLDLKEDVRDECSSLGEVTNVVLYDVSLKLLLFISFNTLPAVEQLEKDGVMTVKFRDPLSADACVLVCLYFYLLCILLTGRTEDEWTLL